MSFENKGSMTRTIVISREPDRSGNYICDGTADEVQINVAIVLANALGGGTVMLRNGQYNIAAVISLLSNVTLRGNGYGTHIRLGNNLNINCIEGNADNYCAVEDLRVDGNKANNADQAVDASQNGIAFLNTSCTYFKVVGCWCVDCERTGIWIDSSWGSIVGNQLLNNGRAGFAVEEGFYHAITSNVARGNTFAGYIYDTHNSTLTGNTDYGGTYGIEAHGGGRNTIVGNGIISAGTGIFGNGVNDTPIVGNCVEYSNVGIYWSNGNFNTVTGNQCRDILQHGIRVNNCDYVTVTANSVWQPDREDSASFDGIYISGGTTKGAYIGNTVTAGDRDGIRVDGSTNLTFYANVCGVNTGSGIFFTNSDDCTVIGNRFEGNTAYGINISDDTCDRIKVKNNDLEGNTAGRINDVGTGTIYPAIVAQFVKEAGTAIWLVAPGSPVGIEIDAADEIAIAKRTLPLWVKQVVQIKVYAISLLTEADAMRLEILIDAGISNEAYNAEAIAVVNKASVTTNFAANDVIYWLLTAADDVDVDDLIGGDHCSIIVRHEVAGNGDCETDAVFGDVLFEYV